MTKPSPIHPARRPLRSWLLRLALAAALGSATAGLAAQPMPPPLDINTATAKQIAKAMRGVGMSRARRVVAYRDEHGPFGSVDELVKVKGIGRRTLERNREVIRVAAEPEATEPTP